MLAGFGVIAAAGLAVAAIPAEDGTITGCYKDNRGDFRIVDSAADCTRSETALTFSQRGPSGPQGPQGEIGPTGPQGLPGPTGSGGGRVFWQFTSGSDTNLRETDTAVASIGLPTGEYFIMGTTSANLRATFDGSRLHRAQLICNFEEGPGGPTGFFTRSQPANASSPATFSDVRGEQTLPLTVMGHAIVNADATIDLLCHQANDAADTRVGSAMLQAIEASRIEAPFSP